MKTEVIPRNREKYNKIKRERTKNVSIWMMWTLVNASMQYGKNESISSA